MKFEKSIVQVLSPYGEWPHKLGMQLVDEKSLEKMKRAARFSTLVGCGIPIFVGHPDESPRSKALPVGKISRIFGLGDGIAVEAKYSAEAFRKISEGKLKSMSPRWRMEKLPDGKFRPVKLISAGLTNNPNIPDSGRIIKSREDTESQAGNDIKIKEIKKTVAAAHAAVARSEKCAASAKKLENLSRAAVVDMRMRIAKASRQRSTAPHDSRPRKISPKELAELASKRSAELGEPYLKSFSAIRKQYVFTTPKQKE